MPKLHDAFGTTKRPAAMLHICGLTLMFCGVGLVGSAAVEILTGTTSDWQELGGVGLVCLVIGSAVWGFTVVPKRIPVLDVFASVTGAWCTMICIGALPYYFTGTITDVDQALFESVSGFTTTGATVLQASETNPTLFAASDGVLFWRSMTQWLGGMGVVVLVIAVLPSVGGWGMGLLQAEAPGPTGERLTPRIRSTARRLWATYLLATAIVTIGYLIAGMGPHDAVSHALTTVSTGGFSRYTLSMAHFNSALIEWIAIGSMFTVGISFTLLYRLLLGKVGPLLHSIEFRLYVAVVAGATGVVYATAGAEHQTWTGFRNALFTVTSLVSTTGYGTVDFANEWEDGAQVALLVLMPLGAMAGSTAGGVKLIRLLIVASYAHRETLRQLHPGLVRPIRLGRSVVDNRVANQVVGFLILALAAFGGGAMLIAMTGADLVTAFSAAATTIGNVGPGLADVGPRSDFTTITPFARLVSIALMILGRLEIYPILLALAKFKIPVRRTTRRFRMSRTISGS